MKRETHNGETNAGAMKPLHIVWSVPTVSAFRELFATTGWSLPDDDRMRAALDGSFAVACAYVDERLVGIVRAISDGAMYGWINDVIVRPEYRGRGIGAALMREVLGFLAVRGIPAVGLFCAQGQEGFYTRLGFSRRPETAPGMFLDLEGTPMADRGKHSRAAERAPSQRSQSGG